MIQVKLTQGPTRSALQLRCNRAPSLFFQVIVDSPEVTVTASVFVLEFHVTPIVVQVLRVLEDPKIVTERLKGLRDGLARLVK